MASLSFSSFQTLFPRPCRHCNAIPNFGPKPRTGFRILSGTGSDPDPPYSDEFGLISSAERSDGSVVSRFGDARDMVVEKTQSSSGQALSRSVRQKRRKKVEKGFAAVEVSDSSFLSGDYYGVVEAKDIDVDGVTTGSVSSRLDLEDEVKGTNIDGAAIGSVSSDTDIKAEAKGIDDNGATGSVLTELDLEAEVKDRVVDEVTSGSVSSELDFEDEGEESDMDGVSSGSVASQLDLEDEAKDNDFDGVVTGSVSFKLGLDKKKDRNVDGVMTGSVSFELELEDGPKDNDFDGVITGLVSFELDMDQAKDRNADGVLTGSVSFKLDLKDDEAKERNFDEVNTDLVSSELDLKDRAKDGNGDAAMNDSVCSQLDSEDGAKDSNADIVKTNSASFEPDMEDDKAKDTNINRVTIGSVSSELELEDGVKPDLASSELDLEDDEAKDSDVDRVTLGSPESSENSLEDEANGGDLHGVTTVSVSSQLDLEDEAKESNVDGVTTDSISSELDSGQIGLNDTLGEAPTKMFEAKETNGTEPPYELLSEISVDEKLSSFHDLVYHNASSTTVEDPKSENISTRELVLSSGAALLLQQPTEGLAGAEDAYFVACQNWLGVADGVAQWSLRGVTLGVYARELMENCERIVSDFEGSPVNDPEEALVKTVAETKSPGSSTILVAHFDGKAFHVANIGDSGFVIIRDGYVFHQSSTTVHEFNFPLHIEKGDDPSKLVQSYKIDLDEGDVIITATDGLFDNLYDQEIASFATKWLKSGLKPQEIAESLAHKAQEVARSPSSPRTPFSDAAQVAGYVGYSGGKLDDVAVIVSVIQNKQSI